MKKKYYPKHFEWLRKNIKVTTNKELTKLFNKRFNMNLKTQNLASQLFLNGIKRKVRPKKFKKTKDFILPKPETSKERREKTIRKGMSKKAIKIIQENYMIKTDKELRKIIADKTGAFFQSDKIKDYRNSNGMTRPIEPKERENAN